MPIEFHQEILAIPSESPRERKLRELAEEYHRRTEEYDRTVCTGPIYRGGIIPANAWEHAAITRNATRLRHELTQVAEAHGFQRCEFHHAIQSARTTRTAAL